MASLEEYIMMTMTDSDEDDDVPDVPQPHRQHNHELAFAMADAKFKKYYRLTKPLVRALIEELRPLIPAPNRASDLTVEMKVLVALNFFAAGSYQTCVGSNKNAGISQPSVSKSIQEVVEAMNNPLIMEKYIKFPRNPLELNTIAQKFYRLYGLPGIVGCIDCTHVAIFPPPNNEEYDERSYINRKGYHAINTQLICDADLNIINVNALFPGCTHDNYIWNQSAVQPVMQEIHQRGGTYYLIDILEKLDMHSRNVIYSMTGFILAIVVMVTLINFVFSILLCNAIRNRRPGLVKAYFTYGMVMTIMAAYDTAAKLLKGRDMKIGVLECVMHSLFLALVYKKYKNMSRSTMSEDSIRLLDNKSKIIF